MKLTPRQRLSYYVHLKKALTRRHHLHLQPMFAGYLAEDAVVFDVGAHAGQFTKLFATMLPKGRVYAFEPSAYARRILQTVVGLKGLDNVYVLPCGLSDTAREAMLHTPVKAQGSLGYGLAFVGETAGTTRALVSDSITLSTVDQVADMLALKRLDFVKADIEGTELSMLEGAHQTLVSLAPTLYLEVDDDCLARNGHTGRDLLAYLEALGYTQVLAVEETSGTMTAASFGEATPIRGNFLFPSPRRPAPTIPSP